METSMKSRINKIRDGIQHDFWGTMLKIVRYSFQSFWSFFETVLSLVFRLLIILLPSRTKTLIKNSLNPKIKLDYKHSNIMLYADTPLNIARARACEKEPETVQWIESFIKPGDIFYDIGANVGAYSLVASRYLEGALTVYAFEPSFSTYAQLCRNIVLNNCQESIYPFLITLSNEKGFVWFSYHSLESGSADHTVTSDKESKSNDAIPEYQQKLLSMNIDYLISDFGFPIPTHIKLDVDGVEFLILKGAEKTLRKGTTKSILVEVRQSDGQAYNVSNLLSGLGYNLHARYDRGDGEIWNYIFTKS